MSAVTPPPGSRTRRIGGDFAAMATGVIARAALATAISIVTARALAPAEMGRYAFLVWLAGLVPVALSLGVPTAITRYTAEAVGGGRPAAAGALVLRLVRAQAWLSLAGAALLAATATLPGVGRAWTLPLALTAACLPLLVLHGSATALLAGLQRFRWPAALGVAQLALHAALLVPVALLAPGVASFLAVHLAVNTLALAALVVAGWRAGRAFGVWPPAPAPERPAGGVLRYTGAVSALVILDAIVWQRTEIAFLQLLSPPAEVAFYALAFGIAGQISRLPYQASIVVFPEFPRLIGAGRRDDLAALHGTAMRYLLLLGAPLAIGLAVIAPFLVRTLYGPLYTPAGVVLALLALGSLPTYLAGASPAVLHATGREDRLVRQAVIAAVLNVALAAALVPLAGALGAALANVVAQSAASALAIRAAMQQGAAGVRAPALARIVGAALVMGAAAALAAGVAGGVSGLVAAVLAGAAVYPLALRALGALTAADLDRARVVVERLPRGLHSRILALVAFLCRVRTRPAGAGEPSRVGTP